MIHVHSLFLSLHIPWYIFLLLVLSVIECTHGNYNLCNNLNQCELFEISRKAVSVSNVNQLAR